MATPHALKKLKHFAEFMAKSINGVLDPDAKPTVKTIWELLPVLCIQLAY